MKSIPNSRSTDYRTDLPIDRSVDQATIARAAAMHGPEHAQAVTEGISQRRARSAASSALHASRMVGGRRTMPPRGSVLPRGPVWGAFTTYDTWHGVDRRSRLRNGTNERHWPHGEPPNGELSLVELGEATFIAPRWPHVNPPPKYRHT